MNTTQSDSLELASRALRKLSSDLNSVANVVSQVAANGRDSDATMTSQQAADAIGISVDQWRVIAARSLTPARIDKRGSRSIPLWSAEDVRRVAAERAANPPRRGRRKKGG